MLRSVIGFCFSIGGKWELLLQGGQVLTIKGLLEGPLIGTLVAYGDSYGDILGIEGLYNDYIRVIW